jgi:hypothetical protein
MPGKDEATTQKEELELEREEEKKLAYITAFLEEEE